MLLVDLNQILLANFFAAVGKHTNVTIEEPMLRHMVLNTLRAINLKFRNNYGKMIIAADSTSNWRKEYFPHYKANRKKVRAESDVDWKAIYQCMDSIKQDLQDVFPYKFIQIDECEADDVIATIVKHVRDEPIMIISGDKDFRQLQVYDNVEQYDPVRKKFLVESDPQQYLFDHILAGDKTDGVPNILSADDCLVTGEQMRKLTGKRKEELAGIQGRINDVNYRNWVRNKTLIDLEMVPQYLENRILNKYNQQPKTEDRSLIRPYMIKHNMNYLLERISEF